MMAERLRGCLEIIRWTPSTLAECLNVENSVVLDWASGSKPIPLNVSAWLEALCFMHEASDLMRPPIDEDARQPLSQEPRLEHIPAYSYHLLRRLHRGPVALRSLFGTDDEAAVFFLVSRSLAERDGDQLIITRAGEAMGEVSAPLERLQS